MPEHRNFESDLHEAFLHIIAQAIPVFRGKAEKICYYCYVTKSSCSCSIFAVKNGKPQHPRFIGISEEDEQNAVDCGLIMDEIGNLCETYSHPVLGELRIVYDLTSDTLEVSIGGEKSWQQASRGKADWMLEFHHANAALRPDANKPAKKLPPLKREWQYKIKGLRDVCIGWDAVCEDGKLTYFITANSKDRHYYHDCHLMQLDMETMEAESLFMCHGICRRCICRMDGNRYFSSIQGSVHCVDEVTGNVKWETKIEKQNLLYTVFADEAHVYAWNHDAIWCLDREDGRILWEIPPKSYGGVLCMDAEHLYCRINNGPIGCVRKSDGAVLWSCPAEGYGTECLFYPEKHRLLVFSENDFLLIDSRTGELLSSECMECGAFYPVMQGEYFYYIDEAADIHCMKLCEDDTLSEIFCRHVDSEVQIVIPDGDRLWAVTRCGYLYLIDSQTGEDLRKPKKASEEACNIIPYADGAILMSNKGQIEYFR